MADKSDLALIAVAGVGLYFLFNSDLMKGLGKIGNTVGDVVSDTYGAVKGAGSAVSNFITDTSIRRVNVSDLNYDITGLGDSLASIMKPKENRYTGRLIDLPSTMSASPVSVMLAKTHQDQVYKVLGGAANPAIKALPTPISGALAAGSTGTNPSRVNITIGKVTGSGSTARYTGGIGKSKITKIKR